MTISRSLEGGISGIRNQNVVVNFLLHKKQIQKLEQKQKNKILTLVPLKSYIKMAM